MATSILTVGIFCSGPMDFFFHFASSPDRNTSFLWYTPGKYQSFRYHAVDRSHI